MGTSPVLLPVRSGAAGAAVGPADSMLPLLPELQPASGAARTPMLSLSRHGCVWLLLPGGTQRHTPAWLLNMSRQPCCCGTTPRLPPRGLTCCTLDVCQHVACVRARGRELLDGLVCERLPGRPHSAAAVLALQHLVWGAGHLLHAARLAGRAYSCPMTNSCGQRVPDGGRRQVSKAQLLTVVSICPQLHPAQLQRTPRAWTWQACTGPVVSRGKATAPTQALYLEQHVYHARLQLGDDCKGRRAEVQVARDGSRLVTAPAGKMVCTVCAEGQALLSFPQVFAAVLSQRSLCGTAGGANSIQVLPMRSMADKPAGQRHHGALAP